MRLAVIDRSNLGKSIVEHAYVAALVISNRPRHYQLRIDGNGGHAYVKFSVPSAPAGGTTIARGESGNR